MIPEERRARTVILAVAPDPLEKLGDIIPKVRDKSKQEFLIQILSDADHQVIERYGILNEEAAKRGRFLPHPTTYVIDRRGIIRWQFTEKDYKVRPTNAMIFEELKKLD